MMKRVGHVATYPGRKEYLPVMLESVVSQFDDIVVVLNQYSDKQRRKLPKYSNVRYVIPDNDLKDTGKFLEPRRSDEYVFTLDDDLKFPPDYAATLIDCYESLPTERVVVGLHGVVYSDLFEGTASSRFVAKFDRRLAKPILVNQLGTGCAMTRGDLLAPMEYMASSQRFVDVRFARYCHENGIGMVCVARPDQWIGDLQPEESIFESYTRVHHGEQLGEILAFGGFGKLDAGLALAVEGL
ncbi:glycosyltransferase family A protein [Pelagibacterium sp. H642]|uniref:glycosyltransferase family A protein n=1 Tax=Pelagibacterium sp. H642 TaxID=1881069 RepID=UPI002815C946|nr:glycosyltransferase family A protein [Pelagibacterium sp. H642]WMT91983.1 glycosyltransferase family 2 protein [Pelagibacterium sp. H642]